MRVFHIYNRLLSAPTTPASKEAVASRVHKRERLRYRDMIWAFHSESQDLLLSAAVASCEGGKMCWPDARALGIFVWLHSVETMVSTTSICQLEKLTDRDARKLTWKPWLEISTLLVIIGIQPSAVSSTSRWARPSLCTGFGDKLLGIKNKL